MKWEYFKFGLISAVLSSVFWFIIWYTNLLITYGWSAIFSSITITSFFGTYLGVWLIGRIRKPSLVYGAFVSLLSIGTTIAFWLAGALSSSDSSIYTRWIIYDHYLNEVSVWIAVPSIIGVFLGYAIIRRTSLSFCPSCGNILPVGRANCEKCGKRGEADVNYKLLFVGIVTSILIFLLLSMSILPWIDQIIFPPALP
jgi:hypothetical protein